MPFDANTDSIEKQINLTLLRRDYQKLNSFEQEGKRVWRLLQSNLYQTDDTLRWHSIEAIAVLLRAQWDLGRQEKVLDYLRRLIWSISDESGGIGWSAPQTIAEIVVAIPQLNEPFVNIMIGRAFSEPTLIKSGLWGIGRLGRRARQSVRIYHDIILASFAVDDPETLGLVSWAMGETKYKPALPYLQKLTQRHEIVRIYAPPCLFEKPLESWVMGAIAEIDRDA
ncbi:DVU0298 family protein [Chloroflexota bacterium]